VVRRCGRARRHRGGVGPGNVTADQPGSRSRATAEWRLSASRSRGRRCRRECPLGVAAASRCRPGRGSPTAGRWRDRRTVELSLLGSGAQCLAVDPSDADIVYAGLPRPSAASSA
jgi:hypothetical protein